MHPTPGPSPWLKQRRERGGDRYKSGAFPIHFDFMYAFPLPSPAAASARGRGRGWGDFCRCVARNMHDTHRRSGIS